VRLLPPLLATLALAEAGAHALGAPAAPPPSETTLEARSHFERGRALFAQERYLDAVSEFELGYRLRAQPLFLYNIAQAYRHAGRPEQAINFYERYLAQAPDAPERAEVERHLRDLRALRATPPPLSLAPQASPIQPAMPTLGPPDSPSTERSEPVHPGRHRWVWYTVGAVALAAAGAATIFFWPGQADPPSTDLGNFRLTHP
jgi:tetratricopeptide (TPR) repeat protein